MANRAYLYTHHPDDEPEYRDSAEWNYDVPLVHFLLVGANPNACSSVIWQVDEKIAIRGDASQSRALVLSFLEWLEPQLPEDFGEAAKRARAFLTRSDRQGRHYHLELGEIYEGMGLALDEMRRETLANVALAQDLFEEVKRLLKSAGATLDDAVHPELKGLQREWGRGLGLCFSDAIYYHLG